MQGTMLLAVCVCDEVVTGGVFLKYLILYLYFWHKKSLSRDLQKKHRATKVSIHESLLPARSLVTKQSNYSLLKYKYDTWLLFVWGLVGGGVDPPGCWSRCLVSCVGDVETCYSKSVLAFR